MNLTSIEEKVERGREEGMGIQKHSPFMTSPHSTHRNLQVRITRMRERACARSSQKPFPWPRAISFVFLNDAAVQKQAIYDDYSHHIRIFGIICLATTVLHT